MIIICNQFFTSIFKAPARETNLDDAWDEPVTSTPLESNIDDMEDEPSIRSLLGPPPPPPIVPILESKLRAPRPQTAEEFEVSSEAV